MEQINNETKIQNTSIAETRGVYKKQPKRTSKRQSIESTSSSDGEDILPENLLETEKHVHESAVKNKLDEISVRKILKRVVTNDHVLALVKLQEEEENSLDTNENKPAKLTRSKIKELRKCPKQSPWKTWDLQLTPIKHIPVKTRPEVTALIAQDLPEDEDDDEYQPTIDDALSDDDHTVESSSDIESQPRTPAKPKNCDTWNPKVVKDGPFVVPQSVSGIKRKLEKDDEEEATIARRTRSKLSLSSTSIEHIESTFVPPDDLPQLDVDDLWNEFLNKCLNPASTTKNEDDDEHDPEYNVAADSDAVDEDEETLGNSIIKISKKELNDLVTELFGIMPEQSQDDDNLAENIDTNILTDNTPTNLNRKHWDGKQETLSDDESTENISNRILFEKKDTLTRLSIGKSEMEVDNNNDINIETKHTQENVTKLELNVRRRPKLIIKEIEELKIKETQDKAKPPPILLKLATDIQSKKQEVVQVEITPDFKILPEQIQILQQQLRQHIQLTTSNFLQLFIHPTHWNLAPQYKNYIVSFIKMCEYDANSVANVCNLRPALDLMTSWEKSTSEDTPENTEIIKFVQEECEKSRRRLYCKNPFHGEFHDTFKSVIANSTVFLYPYLLPPAPYRADTIGKKFQYIRSEDELIAIGLDEFWQYIEDNPELFKPRKNFKSQRPGLINTVQMVAKYMFPWILPKVLMNHICLLRKHGDSENPIVRFFRSRKIVPVVHKLYSFNPRLTLYEQPEVEMPRVWLKYLAKSSKRFKAHLYRSVQQKGRAPECVTVELGKSIEIPQKNSLPIDFTQEITNSRATQLPKPNLVDKFDVTLKNVNSNENLFMATNLYSVVETSTGAFLVPLTVQPAETMNNTNDSPIIKAAVIGNNLPENSAIQGAIVTDLEATISKNIRKERIDDDHCECCNILRKICDGGQKSMLEFYKPNKSVKKLCFCKTVKRPKVTNRLKLFISNYKCQSKQLYQEIENYVLSEDKTEMENGDLSNSDDFEFVILYQLRLLRRLSICKINLKKRIHSLFLNFDITNDDPIQLATNLHKAVKGDNIEIYTEFLGFLTAEQAETEQVFNAYLATHLRNLIKMINEEMTNKEKRNSVLTHLKTIFTDRNITPCQTCTGLLSKMEGYPQIAKKLFSLFPHKRESRCTKYKSDVGDLTKTLSEDKITQDNERVPIDKEKLPVTETFLPTNDQILPNNKTNDPQLENDQSVRIKEENVTYIQNISENINLTPENHQKFIAIHSDYENTIISETVKQEIEQTEENANEEVMSDSSETPMFIIVEDDIKLEPLEWNRDEDKIILEILKETSTPEERKNKTFQEMLEEKIVLNKITDSLTNRSTNEVQERILYLLKILLLSEN